MKVLIIEDTAGYRKILTTWLEKLGHEVAAASDGTSGIEVFGSFLPDMVLLDVVMPGIDGLETARRIRTLGGAWIPIIFISSENDPQHIGAAIEAGGDDYLIKPVNPIVLAAKLMAMERIVAMKSVMASALPAYIDKELQRLTELDNETGLANRHGLQHGLSREYARCARSAQPISAIVARVGDWVPEDPDTGWLTKLAAVFKSQISRAPDLVAHLGEGHFCMILPDTPLTGALHLAEQIHRTVAEIHDRHWGSDLPIRLGVSTHVPESGKDPATLIESADKALYQAQRDRTITASVEQAPFRLTPRELECLQWCALGKSTWEIAQLLTISEAAVNFHMTNIRGKCGVASRRQAVTKAIQLGLIRQG